MESRDDQRRGGGNPAPATTYIILSRSGAGYLGSYPWECHVGTITTDSEVARDMRINMPLAEKRAIGARSWLAAAVGVCIAVAAAADDQTTATGELVEPIAGVLTKTD